MQNKNIFGFDVEWNYKAMIMFALLLGLPNLLGMINISMQGFKIHFFQIAIFIAAFIYGPVGGMMSGMLGSVYSAVMMSNPYIVLFNMILGFFTGMFFRFGMKSIFAVWLAFLVELPVLIVLDHFVVGMPTKVLINLVIALAISNTAWAIVSHYSVRWIQKQIS